MNKSNRSRRCLVSAPRWAAVGALLCAGSGLGVAAETAALNSGMQEKARQLALDAARSAAPPKARVEVQLGKLDPRVRLAACENVEAYLPPLAKMWGKARVGLRCRQGPTAWNVYLPVTVKVFAPSLVAATHLNAGAVLAASDLREAEVDLAEESATPVGDSRLAVGRTLTRSLPAGHALRHSDLKSRQWFAAGETVRIVAVGAGYSVTSEGQALSPGIEGQAVRVRTDGGRVITGQAVAEHRVEVPL